MNTGRDIDSEQKHKAITCDQPLNISVHLYHDVSLKKEIFEIESR
jgi:hypothetical protein